MSLSTHRIAAARFDSAVARGPRRRSLKAERQGDARDSGDGFIRAVNTKRIRKRIIRTD